MRRGAVIRWSVTIGDPEQRQRVIGASGDLDRREPNAASFSAGVSPWRAIEKRSEVVDALPIAGRGAGLIE